MNVLVFDIETIPDLAFVRRVNDWFDLSDEETYEAILAKNRHERKTTFLSLPFHQVVAISVVLKQGDDIKVWSLGDEQTSEKELIQRFYSGIERFHPTLVSWNGGGFDLPVLHYRSLKHGVVASEYWDTGQSNPQLKYNNYVNRYHEKHTDLMDLIALYNPRASAKLDQVALLLGYPGKMGMSGDKVYAAYKAGHSSEIRNYCETDVLNTYLVFLRFQEMRGILSPQARIEEEQKLKSYLSKERGLRPHLGQFLDAMDPASSVCESAV